MITREQIVNCVIETPEIKQDIIDTQKEIDDYNDELSILMKKPVDNKLKIYFIEGNILRRKEFIDNLNKILEYRKNK